MNPSLQNMNLALAIIAFRSLAHLDVKEFKKSSSSITEFFSIVKKEIPEYEFQIAKASYLLGRMSMEEQQSVLELVHSVSENDGHPPSPAMSAWRILKYISLFNKLFSYLQRQIADSISLSLAPMNKNYKSSDKFLCFGDITLTTAFALALNGRTSNYVPFSSSYQLAAEFLDLIVQATGAKGQIKRNIAVDPQDATFSCQKEKYAGAFVFPNADTTSFNIEPFIKEISAPLIFIIPSPLLWMRTTADRKLRKDLIGGNNLRGVVMLPPNSVTDSSCNFSLLILNTPCSNNEVWFIDKSKQKIFLSRKKTLHDALGDFNVLKKDADSAAVDKEQLKENDFNLDPKRYTGLKKELFPEVKPETIKPLSEIAEIIRAQEIPVDEDNWTLTVKEVMPKDIDDIGLIVLPQKILLVSEKGEKRAQQASLQDGDILLSIKSGNWKCGLWPHKEKNYVANANFVIIRIKESLRSVLPPFYLMRLLRSSILQERLHALSVGSAKAPLLKMDDIRQLSIPLPTKEELEKDEWRFKKQIELLEEIRSKTREIEKLNFAL